jgi:hypothetical protein
MRDYSLIKKSLKSSESPGFVLLKFSLTSKLLRRRKRKRKKKRRKKRKLSPRRNKRRRNSLKRKKNPRKNKIKRRKRNLMLRKKNQLKRRKSILLTCYPNPPSTSMIGKESSVTHPTKLLLLTNFGLNSIIKDGLSGKFTILNMKEKVLLVI